MANTRFRTRTCAQGKRDRVRAITERRKLVKVVMQDEVGGKEYFETNCPMGRVGLSEEIAKAALFPASDDAS